MNLELPITRLVTSGMIAFDIGANRGQTSQILSNLGAVTYAFEPIPECIAEIEARNLPKVTIVKTAVSDQEGTAEFHVDQRIGAGMEASSLRVLEGVNAKTIRVQVTTIDTFVDKNAIEPDFIKIDVEGVEEKVIAGGMQTIRRHRPIIVFEVWGYNWPRFERTIRDLSGMYRFECASDGSDALCRYSAGLVTENDDILCLPV